MTIGRCPKRPLADSNNQVEKKVEILAERRLVDAFFKLDEATLRHERRDGHMSEPIKRLNLERGDGVAALIHRPQKNTLVLVRQFRYPAHVHNGPGWILELTAGMLDKDEEPAETMRREIGEETGYVVKKLEFIAHFYLTPGGSSERIFLYYAEVDETSARTAGGGLAEESEDIEIVEMPLENAWEMLDGGQIIDAKTIIGLQWLRRRANAS